MPFRRHTDEQGPERKCPQCGVVFPHPTRFCPHDGTALALSATPQVDVDPLVGTTVDARYRVLEVLGEGGMGTVFRVSHTVLGREFALKALKIELSDEPELAERFLREAQSAAAVQHPNVCEITDFGKVAPQRPYFVMELLRGQALRQMIERKAALPLARVLRILTQVAQALDAAHRAGVVHRDLKPDNIIIDQQVRADNVKIVDFGLARIAGQSRLTRPGLVYGTPHYMSPEQASGATIDVRTDIYSLGVVMFELCAGHVPFEADTYMGVLSKHMYAPPVGPAGATAIESASPIDAIVLRCLQKTPEHRFQTMSELSSELESLSAELSSASTQETEYDWRQLPAAEPRLGIRPKTTALWALGATCLLATIATGVHLSQSESEREVAPQARASSAPRHVPSQVEPAAGAAEPAGTAELAKGEVVSLSAGGLAMSRETEVPAQGPASSVEQPEARPNVGQVTHAAGLGSVNRPPSGEQPSTRKGQSGGLPGGASEASVSVHVRPPAPKQTRRASPKKEPFTASEILNPWSN